LDGLRLEKKQLHAEEAQMAKRHLLLVEKGVATDALHHGVLSQAVQEKLLADIDGRLLRLESAEPDGRSSELEQFPGNEDGRNAVE